MIAVASVPAAHPYVRAICDPESVLLLDDPRPIGATLPDQWWPPRLLDPVFVAEESGYFDIMHVHFGYDSTPPAALRDVAAVLAERHTPLVVTVHDLHNPHFADPRDHLARLDALIPAADGIVTLTPGAADAIAERWGRRARVIPHPHVLPLDAVGADRRAPTTAVVAVHAKSLRANIDPLPVLDALLAADEPAWQLRLDVDEDLDRSPRAGVLTPDRLAELAERGVDVRMHPRFTDRELQEYLGEIDALVLPYRFGTHSGWVEACYDAGVAAIVPACGYFHEQHGDPVYRYSADDALVESLRQAVSAGLALANRRRATAGDRRTQRERQLRHVRQETTSLYRALLARASAA
ncbi:glycosyltransferase [Mycolicibacterium sp. S2-37]|uniref:glycosyltransferase n=1 Tax=Mycolicibacterium sp. S2-37 TaxID=2810297 RepID=UPI001A93B3E5|nr:glycosyltransferase [Mycolicibacterium sp. S2-37]MBO0678592.1 glycosyltransferase [Mycolicibacterium sp. S2-37]